ncbi:MAG TPA: 3-hydroxyacyl-CoA dehydrogenase NAD-binding domain-containing protein [Thermoanaerobaculia bacterium]|nr:3-hydroxyacyl-CoA dehydrogenase NAD-binding domain-containing protein [Thermoanaerobaculia bacterium]
MAGALSLETRDGVAIVRIDVPDSRLNILRSDLFDELEAMLDRIEHEDDHRAAVIASGKPGTFVAGADLRELSAIREASEAERLSRRAHDLFDRIAVSPKPFVAAIEGAALGGGLELALACHARVASDDPATVLALPEVTLGLLPGAGGTQRLPRLIGLPQALPMLLTGSRVRARRALELRLIDRLAPPGSTVEIALALARELASRRTAARWSSASWSPRLGTPAGRRPLQNRILAAAPMRALLLRKARSQIVRRTRGLHPAPFEILEAVRSGLAEGFRAGQRSEIAAFGRLVASAEAKELIRLFELTAARKKRPADAPAIGRVGVVGAGLMGEGIASVTLDVYEVVLEDVSSETAAKARASIESSLERRVRAGALSAAQRDERVARLAVASDLSGLAGCDVIIEAVFEDLALKRRLLAELERIAGPDAVLASNTSAIPIAQLARGLQHPQRVIGMHYFSPVPKMPLLEIVAPSRASNRAIAAAAALGVQQGKAVIVVGDGPGFYTTRILAPYLNEAMMLLEEGVAPGAIDSALREFGFPVGPITLLDEVGIDVAAHVSAEIGEAFAERGHEPSLGLAALAEAGLLGRKSGRGFFLYRDGRKIGPNPDALAALGSPGPAQLPAVEIVERLVLAMVGEAAWCLDDDILKSEDDGDLGAVLGLGFPPFRGGPFAWARREGLPDVRRRLGALESRLGPRFHPAATFG